MGHRPLIWLLLCGLVVGLVVGHDFGLSVDEQTNAAVGADALTAYTGSMQYFDRPSLDEHGPAYFMLFSATSTALNAVVPAWSLADARHLTNFVMFLLAVAAFYFLTLRFVNRKIAWMTTALFATQPLLFGHGFINQKDIPFLALFLSSVVVGMTAVESGHKKTPGWPLRPEDDQPVSVTAANSGSDSARRRGSRVILLGLGLLVLDLLVLGGLKGWAWGMVVSAYGGHAPGFIQALFDRVATDAYKTPIGLYRDKFEVAWFALQLLAVPSLGAAALVSWAWAYPSRALSSGWSWSRVRRFRIGGWLVFAAVVLGLTICVRQLGLFAGVLVAGYAVYRWRAHSVVPLAVYWLLAGGAMLATWPYLWPNPAVRFIQSLYLGSHFPDTHVTLFRGVWMQAGHYPWFFFPNLAGIELTEPAVGLALLGLLVAGLMIFRKADARPSLVLVGTWAAVPLVGLIGFGMTTYGNITHLLFILPPLFVAAGLGLDWFLGKIRPRWAHALIFLALLAPGIWGVVYLHPYEYIYINSFAGGVSGAANFYELDRACLSLREGMEFVNRQARPNATVMLPSDFHQVVPIARSDIKLVDNRTSYDKADYVISCAWVHGLGSWPEQDFRLVDQVRRGQAVLTDVWRRSAASSPQNSQK